MGHSARALVIIFCFLTTLARGGAPPSDSILPADTVAYLSIRNLPDAVDKWERSQFGKLLDDPAMQPFTDHLLGLVEARWTKVESKVGLTWEELKELPSGEFCLAMTPSGRNRSATSLLLDVTGKLDRVDSVMAKIGAALINKGATRHKQVIGSAEAVVFHLPAARKARRRVIRKRDLLVHFVKNGTLIVTDDLKAAAVLEAAFHGGNAKTLAAHPQYKNVMARATAAGSKQAADVRWFVRPPEVVRIRRADSRVPRREGEIDVMGIAKRAGFDSIEAVGGAHWFEQGPYDSRYRVAVFAPPPYRGAMRMLNFPVGLPKEAPAWVPETITSCMSFNWNVQEAFEGFGYVFDAYLEERGAFNDLIDSVREDPNGSQIDLRKDLVGQLGHRAVLITDHTLPIQPGCRRSLIAVETGNSKLLERNIRKALSTDPTVKVKRFLDHTIFEMHDDQPPPVPGSGVRRKVPPSGICVAHGHLLAATHVELLHKVLQAARAQHNFAGSGDYRRVKANLEKLADGQVSVRAFYRTAESVRPTYDLIRQGKLRNDETAVGEFLKEVTGDTQRKQKIDGSLLPPFDVVRRYLGPAGWTARPEQDGWIIEGFTLAP